MGMCFQSLRRNVGSRGMTLKVMDIIDTGRRAGERCEEMTSRIEDASIAIVYSRSVVPDSARAPRQTGSCPFLPPASILLHSEAFLAHDVRRAICFSHFSRYS